MNLHFGLREADITRREGGLISWLGFRPHMAGRELTNLFSEWTTGPLVASATMLTQLAMDNLVNRGIVQATKLEAGGVGFSAYSLTDQSAADRINPGTVELAPREAVLLGFMDISRNEPQTATELDARLRQEVEPDSWRTEACLGHLARLGLVRATDNPPGAYILS